MAPGKSWCGNLSLPENRAGCTYFITNLIRYNAKCLVKRSRALLGSNPTRDNQAWADEYFRSSSGGLRCQRCSLPSTHSVALSCLKKSTPRLLERVAITLGFYPQIYHKTQNAYSIGAVEEPRLRISGRRVFEPVDVRRLAKHFGVTLKAEQAAAVEPSAN